MSIAMKSMKLVVQDLALAEQFYSAMGFRVVSRNRGGEAEVAQEQCWLSETGDATSFLLILSRFLEFAPRPGPVYPGEVWLVFTVSDVDATLDRAAGAGGAILRAAQDRPEHDVRAAVISDPEGHVIEVVGPMAGR